MNPLRHSRGVGSNSETRSVKVPLPCATVAWSAGHPRLGLGNGQAEDGNWWRYQDTSNRAEAFEGFADSERFAGATDVIECACVGGHDGCAYRAGRLWASRHVLLAGVVDWWKAASVGAARHTVDDQVVQELRQDCGTGVVAGQGCGASLVYQSEWSGGDASCCETDRADGCAEHGLDEFDGIHPFGSSASGSSRDKGGE